MSTAAASAPEARDLTSWLVQDQEPQEPSDQAAPSDERGREGQQQSVAAANRDHLGSLGVVVISSLVVSQLAWIGALVYLGHLLVF